MDCTRYKDLITMKVAGEMSPSDARTLDEHVASCRSCAEELVSLTKAVEFVPPMEVPRVSFAKAFLKASEAGQTTVRPFLFKWAVSAAAAALLIAIALLAVLSGSGTDDTPIKTGGNVGTDIVVQKTDYTLPVIFEAPAGMTELAEKIDGFSMANYLGESDADPVATEAAADEAPETEDSLIVDALVSEEWDAAEPVEQAEADVMFGSEYYEMMNSFNETVETAASLYNNE